MSDETLSPPADGYERIEVEGFVQMPLTVEIEAGKKSGGKKSIRLDQDDEMPVFVTAPVIQSRTTGGPDLESLVEDLGTTLCLSGALDDQSAEFSKDALTQATNDARAAWRKGRQSGYRYFRAVIEYTRAPEADEPFRLAAWDAAEGLSAGAFQEDLAARPAGTA